MTDLATLPTDVHIHIQPREMMHPHALRTLDMGRGDPDVVAAVMDDPGALVAHLDREGIGRVGVINYVAPGVMGFTAEVNAWAARYRKGAGGRVIAFGGIHPPACKDVRAEMRQIIDELRLDGLKLHPPHQELAPDAYRTGACPELATIYGMCQEAGLPVMFHTGTSIFPGARSRLGDPLALDDVAVDFPELRIIMAHGGRPFWHEQAFFLLRRHPNIRMDISGIPPQRLLTWFPRIEEVSSKVLFGTDWPSPGVRTIRTNLDAVQALPLSEQALDRIFRTNALELFPIGGRS